MKGDVSFFKKYIGGDLFRKETVTRQMPFIIYVVILAMAYITNTYFAVDVQMKLMRQSETLGSKKIEYIYNSSKINKMTKQSQLVISLKKKKIKESVEPLKKITINVKQN